MDVETRAKVSEVVKDNCPLRTVLKAGKECPYFGSSKSCRDCSYDWEICADNILKLAKSRRALYEKEREKTEELKKELAEALSFKKSVQDLLTSIGYGFAWGENVFKTISQLREKVAEKTSVKSAFQEVQDLLKEQQEEQDHEQS